MDKKICKRDLVFLGGLIGIIAAIIMIITDFILIGRPVSGYEFLKLGTKSMAGLPNWRITAGTFVGIVVLPFQIAGLITIYYGLKPAGKIISSIVVLTAAHGLIMGVAFHVAYAFIASGWKIYNKTYPASSAINQMIQRFDYYWNIIIFIILADILICSICYIVLILKKNTLYPKWMALFNPLLIGIIIYALALIIPAPIGGFIGPASLNISTLIFLILSTVAVSRRIKN